MTSEDFVSQIMSKNVITVDSSEKVLRALQIMAEKGIGSVIVIENGKPVGIITERDIAKKLVQDKSTLDKKVKDVMSKPLITVSPDTGIFEALQIMRKNNIRRLPVVSAGKLEGIVTEKDLLYWVLKVAYAPYPPP
ncbi:MAG: CBS domain-containing protein [Candidatus Bathyarchaeia archaeon]|nr:CBS domain-containing protein [Candidatus Bathyarchaeota archaeon]